MSNARQRCRQGLAYVHQFRHTMVHRWISEGVDESDLMMLAGWKSRQMLNRYGRSARRGTCPGGAPALGHWRPLVAAGAGRGASSAPPGRRDAWEGRGCHQGRAKHRR